MIVTSVIIHVFKLVSTVIAGIMVKAVIAPIVILRYQRRLHPVLDGWLVSCVLGLFLKPQRGLSFIVDDIIRIGIGVGLHCHAEEEKGCEEGAQDGAMGVMIHCHVERVMLIYSLLLLPWRMRGMPWS